MTIYEMRLKVYLLESIILKNSLSSIGSLIDSCLAKDEKFLNLHKTNAYKYYTFAAPFPIEQNKIYKRGSIYSIQIRTVDEDLKNHFMKNLQNSYTKSLKALTISCKPLQIKLIQELYSVTPFIVKFDKGYWKGTESIDTVLERLRSNIIKKYNNYNRVKIDENFDFITYSRLTNEKPIAFSYKGIQMLGDKAIFKIDNNEMAQKLANFAIGTGVGEISARGFGFVNYREC